MAAHHTGLPAQRRVVALVNTAICVAALALAGYVVFNFFAGRGFGGHTIEPVVGQPAPDFTLSDLQGEQVRLASLRGKAVVINLWATWCAPCRAEIPDLVRQWEAHRGQGLVVLGVDVQESGSVVRQYAAEMKMTYPVLLDTHGAVTANYGVPGLPATFFVDRQGVLRDLVLGAMTRDQVTSKIEALLG